MRRHHEFASHFARTPSALTRGATPAKPRADPRDGDDLVRLRGDAARAAPRVPRGCQIGGRRRILRHFFQWRPDLAASRPSPRRPLDASVRGRRGRRVAHLRRRPEEAQGGVLGTPDVAASALDALLDAADEPDCAWEVHAVVSQPGRPRGRGRSKSGPPPPSPVAECALRRGVPEERVLCPVKANEPAFLEALERLEPDLAVTAAYGNFLPSAFLAIPRLGTLNIHPSLLPQFRGAAPVQRALERGVPVTGVTVAYTVLEMDAGPVVRRVERPLDGSEKHVDLLRELFATGAAALLEALPSVWTGEAATLATPQAEFGEPTHAPKVSPEEGVLDFKNETATTLRDKVRGFDGWPGTKGAFLVKKEDAAEDAWQEVTLKIITANVFEDASETTAAGGDYSGAVTLTKKTMRVPCANGTWLEVTEVQPPGKKAMDAASYANGLKGSVLKVLH